MMEVAKMVILSFLKVLEEMDFELQFEKMALVVFENHLRQK